MRSPFRRPSHATVVAYLALFLALGGSSYAVTRIGSKQIVNNSVAGKDVRNNSLTSADVKNRSLLAKDFKAGLPRGAPGETGSQGAPGQPGQPGISVIQGSTNEALITIQTSEERFPPWGFSPAEPGFTGTYWQISPDTPVELSHLVGRLNAAPGAGSSRYFQLFNVDANTVLLSCQAVGTATSCDTGDVTATLPASTRYSIRLFSGNPAPAPSQGAAWTFRMLAQ